ncbi:MAG: lysoplasmalogenase [Bacilli bacterium]|nr:lysoplasmalogenase [Bacilli bacterium]
MKNKTNKIISIIFIALELCLYIMILFLPKYIPYKYPAYISILLAFAFSLFQIKNKDMFFEIVALCFTLVSDTFLVMVEPQNKLFGMIFFLVVQIAHMLYIHNYLTKKEQIISLSIRLGLMVISSVACVLVLKKNTDAVSILSMLYITNLVINIVFSFYKSKKLLLFAIGLVLFILCDINVGMSVLIDNYISVSSDSLIYQIFHPNFNVIWMFYVPSQTLITLNVLFSKPLFNKTITE